jgi:hypothetical protein
MHKENNNTLKARKTHHEHLKKIYIFSIILFEQIVSCDFSNHQGDSEKKVGAIYVEMITI